MNERLKTLRKRLKLNQGEFGEKINLSQAHISALENGTKLITDRVIYDIRREFNVNEEWLRNGTGEMFAQKESISLDDYANRHHLTDVEIDIIKSYIELDSDVRKSLMTNLKMIFGRHDEVSATTVDSEKDIKAELEKYRLELEAEKKAKTLSVSEERETS